MKAGLLSHSLVPVIAFCLASSATYILNDILDADNDLNHPVKKLRPIPAGLVSKFSAAVLAVVFLSGSIFLCQRVSPLFLAILLAYVAISSAYSVKLKHLPIVDLFCISAGFLLRLQAGGEAFGVIISDWLFLSVFLLAVFLSTGKRLYEKNMLGTMAGKHRHSLS